MRTESAAGSPIALLHHESVSGRIGLGVPGLNEKPRSARRRLDLDRANRGANPEGQQEPAHPLFDVMGGIAGVHASRSTSSAWTSFDRPAVRAQADVVRPRAS